MSKVYCGFLMEAEEAAKTIESLLASLRLANSEISCLKVENACLIEKLNNTKETENKE